MTYLFFADFGHHSSSPEPPGGTGKGSAPPLILQPPAPLTAREASASSEHGQHAFLSGKQNWSIRSCCYHCYNTPVSFSIYVKTTMQESQQT